MTVTVIPDGFKEVVPPLSDADVESLSAGDRVRITGVLYTARDAAHGRLLPLIEGGETLPIDVRGQIIYYTGPSPARPATSWARSGRRPAGAWTGSRRGS